MKKSIKVLGFVVITVVVVLVAVWGLGTKQSSVYYPVTGVLSYTVDYKQDSIIISSRTKDDKPYGLIRLALFNRGGDFYLNYKDCEEIVMTVSKEVDTLYRHDRRIATVGHGHHIVIGREVDSLYCCTIRETALSNDEPLWIQLFYDKDFRIHKIRHWDVYTDYCPK